MAEMYRQLAATGGIPYEQETNVKMSGEGPMAGVLREDGQHLIDDQTVTGRSKPRTLAADLFAPPAGYKIKEQK